MGAVTYLAGEWVPAWLWMSTAFLVAVLGVAGLGWWVVRGDAINRRGAGQRRLRQPLACPSVRLRRTPPYEWGGR
jgi:hypothetical protein